MILPQVFNPEQPPPIDDISSRLLLLEVRFERDFNRGRFNYPMEGLLAI